MTTPEQRNQELERQLEESRRKAQEAERRLKENEHKARESERRLQESERRREQIERRLQKSERRLEKTEHQLQDAREQNQKLQTNLLFVKENIGVLVKVCIESLTVLKEKFPADAQLQERLWKELKELCWETLENRAFDKFLRRTFQKHSEQIDYSTLKGSTAKFTAELVNTVRPIDRSVAQRSKQMGSALTVVGQAVSQNAQFSGDATVKAAALLVQYPDPNVSKKEQALTPGRQSLEFERREEEIEDAKVKCECGNTTDFIAGAISQSAVRDTEDFLHDIVHTVASRHQQIQCRKCGRVHLVYSDGNVPVTPTSTMGIAAATAAAVLYADGIPLAKVQKELFGDESCLGHETLGRNIHKLSQETFEPLKEALMENLKKQHVLVADETVIKVLQSQGKGVCEAPESTRQKDYLAAVCSCPYEDKRAVIFKHLGGRGVEAIGENLARYAPSVWVTDAYTAYDTYCEGNPSLKHQCCLVHLRRELLDAIDIDALAKSLGCKTPQEALAQAARGLKQDAAVYKLCCVVQGISKIYGYEKTVKRDRTKPIDVFYKEVEKNRKQHATVLMNQIDTVMVALAVEFTKIKGGKYICGSRNDQLSKAVTYYMNHRANFREFLDDPKIPLDSNAVESSIRAVAVLRKASDFKQSVEYTESLCTLLSLTETAKLNNLKNPIAWLTDYAKAFFLYRASKTLTHEVNQHGRSLDSKLLKFNEDEAEGFDIEPWLPWNYAAKKPQ